MSKEEQKNQETQETEVTKAPESVFSDKAPAGWTKTDEQYPLIEFSKKGQVLECVFQDAKIITTQNGESILWDITVNGELFSLWSSTVLESQRARLCIEKGQKMAIEYNGKKSNKAGGRDYKNFSIYLP